MKKQHKYYFTAYATWDDEPHHVLKALKAIGLRYVMSCTYLHMQK